MAPMPSSSSRRAPNTRRRSGRNDILGGTPTETPVVAETRSMKRKYVPDGPGGDVRYVESAYIEEQLAVSSG